MAARRVKRTVKEYSVKLPEGVTLVSIFATRSYKLMHGGKMLDSRREEMVLMWKNPAAVFASIARRALREKEKA